MKLFWHVAERRWCRVKQQFGDLYVVRFYDGRECIAHRSELRTRQPTAY